MTTREGAAGGREGLAFDLYGTLVDPVAVERGLACEVSCHCGLLNG